LNKSSPIQSESLEGGKCANQGDVRMPDSIISFTFSDIETLLKAISKTELCLLEHLTAQMKADLELLQVLEQLKTELTNLISVK